jgi:hypothetical protein
MKREGHEDVEFFKGTEVERTPAFGKKTLFVVGIQPIDSIIHTCMAKSTSSLVPITVLIPRHPKNGASGKA